MKKIFTLLLFMSAVIVQAKTLDDFLSTSLLGLKIEKIEQSYNLESGKLKDIPAYIEIDELEFEKLKWKLNVFCRNGECKAYGVWVNQLRIKDKNGKLKHRDNVEIYGVFQVLREKLTTSYGSAPRVKFKSRCCGCGSGPLSQSYVWVNETYALILMFHDNVTTQSITLRQYRRDEKNGEFRGGDELSFLENLYNYQSGKLPDDWPSAKIRREISRDKPIVDDCPDRQLGHDESVDQEKLETVKPERNTSSHVLSIIVGVLFIVILILFIKKWKGCRR